MTTEEYLTSKGVTMEIARDFLLNNYELNLQTVFNVCKEFGVNNNMIADILQSNIPGLTGAGVASYFDANGFNGNELDFSLKEAFKFTQEWIEGKTLYNVYFENGYNSESFIFNEGGSLTVISNGEMISASYSIDNEGILKLTTSERIDYIKAYEEDGLNALKLKWDQKYEEVKNSTYEELSSEYFFLDESSAQNYINLQTPQLNILPVNIIDEYVYNLEEEIVDENNSMDTTVVGINQSDEGLLIV